jgi:putative MATE family efflux protein
LALPVLAEQLLHALVALVDTWLAGNFLSTGSHLAAMGLVAYVLWLIPSMFAAIAIGATAMTARLVGARDVPLAARVANQALVMGSVLSLVAMASVWWFDAWFVDAMQLEQDAAPLALRYLEILIPVIPAIMVEQVGIACLRGAGDTISGLFAMTLMNVVNLVLSSALVIGLGPIPRWGWDGLAFGTAAGHALGAMLVLGLLGRGRAGMQLQLAWLRPDRELARRLLRIGLPGGADVALILVCHLCFVAIINSLGTLPAAAHSVGVRIEGISYLPGAAFQVAAATMAGQFLGAQDARRAMRSARMACLIGGAIMVSSGVLMFCASDWLASFFTGGRDNSTAQLAGPLLRVVSLTQPSLALTMILTGALRGAGDTRWPLLFSLIGFVGVRLPLATVLAWDQVWIPGFDCVVPGLGWGVLGAWYAMAADIVLRSVLVAWRFWQGGWRQVRV